MPAERIDGLNQGLRSNSRQGGRSLKKGTCTDYDVIVTSEFKFEGSSGFRDCRTLDRNYFRGKQRIFFKVFSVEIVMHHVCALRFPI